MEIEHYILSSAWATLKREAYETVNPKISRYQSDTLSTHSQAQSYILIIDLCSHVT